MEVFSDTARGGTPADSESKRREVGLQRPVGQESADLETKLLGMAPPVREDHTISMKYPEWIGWLSSAILLATLARQVYTQWKSRSVSGVSRWLFVGQVTASVGFTVYSLLLRNWVYACSNIAILTTAIAGEAIYLRNKRGQSP